MVGADDRYRPWKCKLRGKRVILPFKADSMSVYLGHRYPEPGSRSVVKAA